MILTSGRALTARLAGSQWSCVRVLWKHHRCTGRCHRGDACKCHHGTVDGTAWVQSHCDTRRHQGVRAVQVGRCVLVKAVGTSAEGWGALTSHPPRIRLDHAGLQMCGGSTLSRTATARYRSSRRTCARTRRLRPTVSRSTAPAPRCCARTRCRRTSTPSVRHVVMLAVGARSFARSHTATWPSLWQCWGRNLSAVPPCSLACRPDTTSATGRPSQTLGTTPALRLHLAPTTSLYVSWCGLPSTQRAAHVT